MSRDIIYRATKKIMFARQKNIIFFSSLMVKPHDAQCQMMRIIQKSFQHGNKLKRKSLVDVRFVKYRDISDAK